MPKRKTTEEFIDSAIATHGSKYNYSKVDYINNLTPVSIICHIHGEFIIKPAYHLTTIGCQKCGNNAKSLSKLKRCEQFIVDATQIHGYKYDYSKVEYISSQKEVIIICKLHGEYLQKPKYHTTGSGCHICGRNISDINRTKSTEKFISDAIQIHGNRYDYSYTSYIRNTEKVKIYCKTHGEFKQEANSHLRGIGCPKCKVSKNESKISDWLIINNIEYVQEKRFSDCRYKYPLPFDFYIPSLNICIEYDGEHHFIPIKNWGGENHLRMTQLRDSIKTQYCIDNGITLLRIPYTEFDNIEQILEENIKQ